MRGTKRVWSRRRVICLHTILLAGVLALSACEGKDGREEATQEQTTVVPQEEGTIGERADSDPSPESAEVADGLTLRTLLAEWNGELQCGNRTLKPGGAYAVSIEEETVTCRIDLQPDRIEKLTVQDLNALSESWFTGYWSSEFIERMESWRHQLVVRSRRSGAIEVELQFPSAEIGVYDLEIADPAGGEKRIYRFLREVPFRYEITRPTDADTAILERGVRDYLLAGETHVYNVTFTHPVDRASVEAFDYGMEGLEVEYDWHSDRSVTVRLTFDEHAVMEDYDRLFLDFHRARPADGIYREPAPSGFVMIQPTRRKTFAFLDPSTGRRETFLNTLISYTRLDRSPSGQYVLAEETTVRESMPVYNYVLLDKAGKRIKPLLMDAPVWLRGEDALLYRRDRSILRYDVDTGGEHAVWTASAPVDWVYYDYHAPSGRLAVVTLRQNDSRELEGDLYLYEKVTDPEPRVFRGVFFDREPVGDYYPEGVRFIDGGKLYIEYITGPNDYVKERRVMDWTTGELTALEPAAHSFPLTRGGVLHYADDGWRIVGADGGIRSLAAPDPEQYADPGIWRRSVPVGEDWVALLRGGGAADLLHVPSGKLKTVRERLLPPFPWSGEMAYSTMARDR